jgi:purine-binding chemotaxis protein CheW
MAVDQSASGTLVCVFEVAGRTFAVDIAVAREARVFDHCTAVPLAPRHLRGMVNLRGAIIPLVDLCVLRGLPAGPDTLHALVVEAKGVRVALAVDRVVGVESLDEPLEPFGDIAAADRLEHGQRRRGDEAVPILDVERIVQWLAYRPSPRTHEGL